MAGAPAPSPPPFTGSGAPPDGGTRHSLHSPPRFDAKTISRPSAVQRLADAPPNPVVIVVLVLDLAVGLSQSRDDVVSVPVTRRSVAIEGDVASVGRPRGAIFRGGIAVQSKLTARANELDVNVEI